MGLMYDSGKGVTKDMGEAVRWYRKAADEGYESAKEKLKLKTLGTVVETGSFRI